MQRPFDKLFVSLAGRSQVWKSVGSWKWKEEGSSDSEELFADELSGDISTTVSILTGKSQSKPLEYHHEMLSPLANLRILWT